MNHKRSIMKLAPIVAVCLVSPLWSCASTRPQTQHLLQKNQAITISSQEMRVRVRSLARPLAGILQTAADEISRETNDPEVRRAALLAKTEAIPALFDALFRKDPGEALIDTSALVEQIKQNFTDGIGVILNDDEKKVVLDAAEDMKHRLQSVYLAAGASQQEIDAFWITIEEWARKHPLQGSFTVRDSTASLLAASTAIGGGGLGAAISGAQDELADFAVRADLYAEILPRQARWQAQLLIEEMMAERFIAHAFDQVGPIPLSLESLPVDIDKERQALIEDFRREGILAGHWIRAERVDSLEYFSRERQAILDALIDERIAILQSLTMEREALIEAVDSQRAAFALDLETVVASALAETRRELVDHFVLRLAQLTAVVLPLVLVGGLILVWFARRGKS